MTSTRLSTSSQSQGVHCQPAGMIAGVATSNVVTGNWSDCVGRRLRTAGSETAGRQQSDVYNASCASKLATSAIEAGLRRLRGGTFRATMTGESAEAVDARILSILPLKTRQSDRLIVALKSLALVVGSTRRQHATELLGCAYTILPLTGRWL